MLRRILLRDRWPVAGAYGLLVAETLVDLARPVAWGTAIDSLLAGSPVGLVWAALQHLLHLAVGTARTQLAREFIVFLEQRIPDAMRGFAYLVGGSIALALYDWRAVVVVGLLSVPVALFGLRYARVAERLNRGVNDRLEREVAVINAADRKRVPGHFAAISRWRVRLSDAESTNFALTEFFVLAMVLASLWLAGGTGELTAGGIAAVLSYLWMTVAAFDQVPVMIDQWAKLRDIAERLAAQLGPSKATGV